MYQFLLEPLGYGVEMAEDGLQGLDMAVKKPYDLILLDVHMPNMNGLEVLKRVKEVRPELKVIIFSPKSDASFSVEQQAERLGVCSCLYKPADLKDILKAVEQAVNIRNGGACH